MAWTITATGPSCSCSRQANTLTDQPDELDGFASTYDLNGDGVIDAYEASLRTMANSLYSWINEVGDKCLLHRWRVTPTYTFLPVNEGGRDGGDAVTTTVFFASAVGTDPEVAKN